MTPAQPTYPIDPDTAENTGEHTAGSRYAAQLLPEVRTERLIAVGRLLLSVCGLFAVALDPPDVASQARTAALILLVYSTYAGLLLFALRYAPAYVLRHRLAIHLFDLVVFALLVVFTGRTVSPFFSPVVFPIVAATLRWQQLGAIRTGAGALLFFLVIHLYDASAGPAALNTALVRYAFLAATTLLLAEIGRLERKHGMRLTELARWPHVHAADRVAIAAEVLAQAARAAGAPRALLLWEEPEEPWMELFTFDGSSVSPARLPNGYEPITNARIAGTAFLWRRGRGDGSVLYVTADGPRLQRGQPFAPALAQRLEAKTVLSLPLRGTHIEGYLLLLDVDDVTVDDLQLGEVLGRHVSESLQHFVLTEQLGAMSVAEERVRVSRDLHDGVLQTLTGVALRLATVRQLVAPSPDQAREQLQELEQLILEEQRDLRFFTLELRLRSGLEADGLLFPQALAGLLARVQKVWGVRVIWEPQEAQLVPPALAWETYQLVHEGLVNAARHGHARTVSLHFSAGGGALGLSLADDGAGFPFHGTFALDTLVREKRGPRSLRERVEALNGDMRIESSPSGANIEIRLPAEVTRA